MKLKIIEHDAPDRSAPRKIEIEADECIDIQCGKASIRLSSDGRIAINGVDITSRAIKNHKIRGGQVEIN